MGEHTASALPDGLKELVLGGGRNVDICRALLVNIIALANFPFQL